MNKIIHNLVDSRNDKLLEVNKETAYSVLKELKKDLKKINPKNFKVAIFSANGVCTLKINSIFMTSMFYDFTQEKKDKFTKLLGEELYIYLLELEQFLDSHNDDWSYILDGEFLSDHE